VYLWNVRATVEYVLLAVCAGIVTGIALGTFSGLVPGIHANTMAGILLAVQGILAWLFGVTGVAVSLFCALITHTFLDCVPSTVLGVPDADTALSVLPAHRLSMEGRAEEAIRLSALGSALSVPLVLPVFAIFFLFLPSIQPVLDWWVGIILLGVAGILVIHAESPGWSLVVFFASGLLGLFTFRYDYLSWHPFGSSSLLMPLLTGLFGIAVLAVSSYGALPEQGRCAPSIGRRRLLRTTCIGTAAGALVGWMPGLSNATANALLSPGMQDGESGKEFIVATSAANTANAFLGLAALFALGRARNGVMVALSGIAVPPLDILLIAGTAAALVAYLLTLWWSRGAQWFSGIPVRKVSAAVILFVVLLAVITTGPFGLFILACATAVGFVPPLVNVRRTMCMGAIMLPLILSSLELMVY
jgi:putative membrane protein